VDWIAEQRFECERESGEKFTAIVRIGRPVQMPSDGDLAAYGRVPVSFEPFVSERWVGGDDKFQALCLAIHFVRLTLKDFASGGGRVYFHDSTQPIDLDAPSFVS
jgi:hypothetical protein